MDTELARTFLTVIAAGNFRNAASRLFVTQSTVSARIAALEEQLGCSLFVRNKAGTTLTPAGLSFHPFATTLVRTVERARQDIGVALGFRASVTIGGRFGLWDDLLFACLPRIRKAVPDIAIRAEMAFEDELIQGLVEGRTNIGVMYTPQNRPGLVVELLLEEQLVYVTTSDDNSSLPGEDYVYIDWGPEFASKHSAAFPDFLGAGLSANIGWLGLTHILAYGGAGYFPLRLIEHALAARQLHRHPDAPDFQLPAYLVYPADPQPETLRLVLQIVRDVTAEILHR
ncbi:LysR family transcriptional regulator [Pseudomonas schmalbachii]|uniref:LysR family transcriptional regulator n=1 Tax=Pseudomonas schmalbachii TaxID=2816993 RepID=A0ABS3TKA6_9PSED|nr:LysR family transcriptional regulator [Pseudomonas schmalbachii]MBO3274071.1 LysR family transcriptional regulator [Pseudomonas schmalbachii]